MEFIAKQIAQLVGGRIEGDENAKVSSFAKIEEGKAGAISFLSNPKYTHYIYETQSSVVLIGEDVQLERPVTATLIRVENAYESVAKLLQIYQSMQPQPAGISPLAFVDETAEVAEGCYIGPFAYIGAKVKVGKGSQIFPHAVVMEGVSIGEGCKLYPNTTVYHGTRIGNRVTLHAGSVIGADGFGFAPTPDGYSKIPQIGTVTIDDDVEIGANTCVDRSTMGTTHIGKGVKLDNLVQIAHNCEVGEHTVMSAQAGLAGSTKIGAWCMAGGQSGFAGHIKVADKTFVGAQCGVISNTKSGEQLIGSPAMDAKDYFRAFAVYRRLPEMYRELGALRKEIEELKQKREEA